ncbi:MAG: Plug domain-containing protein, partial [Bacteroidetes bacterium]|nr:Plug domain-containing protein [Bacteroidota bacterium]
MLTRFTFFLTTYLIFSTSLFSIQRVSYNNFFSCSNGFEKYYFHAAEDDSIIIKTDSVTSPIALIDTAAILDSLRKALAGDSVVPIKSYRIANKFSETNLSQNQLTMENYFDLYSQLSYLPNNFYRNLGSPGGIGELLIQGNGFRNVSLLLDERNINDAFTNTFDLKELRLEEIESIELIPTTRAFLYGNLNESAAINLKSKELYSQLPYSRIKYIEAPYENLLVDGMFNANFHRRLNFDFGLTKHSQPGRFKNSERDLWAGKIKLTHFISNEFNWNFAYRYSKSLIRFNEGVSLSKMILRPNETINDVIYDELLAPVVNEDAYHKWTKHNLDFEARGNFLNDHKSISSLKLYFSQSQREYRDGERELLGLKIHNDYWSKVWGAKFKQNFSINFVELEAAMLLERKILESPFIPGKKLYNEFQSYILSEINLSSSVKPSFYLKYYNQKRANASHFSFGGDISFTPIDNLHFYTGLSQVYYIPAQDEIAYDIYKNIFELGKRTSLYSRLTYANSFASLSMDYYLHHDEIAKTNSNAIYYSQSQELLNGIDKSYPQKSIRMGGSVSGLLKYWKLN